MNDGEMTEHQFQEFIKGWRWAQKDGPLMQLQFECDEFKAGFAFYKQVRAEQQEPPCSRH